MQLFLKAILFLFTIVSFTQTKAQYIDSTTSAIIQKHSWRFNNYDQQYVQKPFPVKSLALPAFMIAYGFTTLKSDGLYDINEKVQEEIWQENPHKKQHIDNFLQFAPAIAVYGLNMAGIHGKHNLKDRSMLFLMSSVFTNATVFSIKKLTHQQRPDGTSASFPSGHTAQAFASAEFMRQEYKDISPWYAVAGYAAATATGILRMYNNKHWLSDVVAGAGIGMASTKIAYWLYPTIQRKLFKNKPINTFVMPFYNNKVGGVSMVYNFH
jgi:hypothetical protein